MGTSRKKASRKVTDLAPRPKQASRVKGGGKKIGTATTKTIDNTTKGLESTDRPQSFTIQQ